MDRDYRVAKRRDGNWRSSSAVAIREVVDREDRAALCSLSRNEIRRRICEQVAAHHPELELSPTGDEEARWLIGKLAALLGALVVLPILMVLALPWYLVLRRKETRRGTMGQWPQCRRSVRASMPSR